MNSQNKSHFSEGGRRKDKTKASGRENVERSARWIERREGKKRNGEKRGLNTSVSRPPRVRSLHLSKKRGYTADPHLLHCNGCGFLESCGTACVRRRGMEKPFRARHEGISAEQSADQHEKGPQSDRSAHKNGQIIRNATLDLPHPVTTPQSQDLTTIRCVSDPSAAKKQERAQRAGSFRKPAIPYTVGRAVLSAKS